LRLPILVKLCTEETSGVLLRFLAAEKPVVVSDIGAFAEIPDDCCWKVPVGGEEEVARVAQAMLALASEPDRRKQLGERARAHVAAHHTVNRVAAQYAAFLHRVFG
jgi:glycosyltransferase involved in cell wall biosynthesis